MLLARDGLTAEAMAAAGISYSSVQRIWHAHGLKPHLVDTFKGFARQNFAAKVQDVGSTSIRRPGRWSSASMKTAKSRPSTVLSRACR